MSRVESFLRFLWDFVIGDDWRIAAGVAVALAVTALVADTSVPAWWVLPVAVAVLITASVWRAARSRPMGRPAAQEQAHGEPHPGPADTRVLTGATGQASREGVRR